MLLAYQTTQQHSDSLPPLHTLSMFPASSTNSDSHMNLHSKLPNSFISKPHKNLIHSSTSSKITVSPTYTYTTSSKENHGFFPAIPRKGFSQKFQFLLSKGASESDIVRMVVSNPTFMKSSLKTHKIMFEYFLSKGVSSSDIVSMLTANPTILKSSLEKRIIPLFELLRRFFKTNKDTIVCLIRLSKLVTSHPLHLIVANINLMSDFGVSDSVIVRLLQNKPSIFSSKDLINLLEEVKGLGFDPSITAFGTALIAEKSLSKKLWDEKVEVFKKWGWSDEVVIRLFRSHPDVMLTSIEKINLVMSFWVNQLGWDPLEHTKRPRMFSHSLEKWIVPRASVLQFLLMKGLRKKNASLVRPFAYSANLFLKKFVFGFKEESDYPLKLYEEKLKLANTKENNGMSFTKRVFY